MSMSTVSAPSKAASTSLMLCENWLRHAFPSELHTVRTRSASDTQPAAVIVERANPTSAAERVPLLVVEISDWPLEEYPAEEANRYAAEGLRDYWVLEVAARRLHIFRDPQPDSDAKHGHRYGHVRTYSTNSLVAPLAAELHLAQVVNLLPW
ncbi:MAG: Uma2 family endonuclease [Gemmataceae bacterium]|nr:Uma2 family endonuclease [Gemmata sp.]MDW8198490.1 Uma2 family endonuclease [Gemmataceae bacterium]